MDIFKDNVLDIMASTLNVDKGLLTDDLSIGDIPEWDSVGNLLMIGALEEKLGIEIPLEDLFDLTTIEAIVDEVRRIKK